VRPIAHSPCVDFYREWLAGSVGGTITHRRGNTITGALQGHNMMLFFDGSCIAVERGISLSLRAEI
jgi:hypothetical protein